MKLTLLADIHGNLGALKAVLRHAHNQGADQNILNLGDSIGYGPYPDEVVRLIQNDRFINILGNYDEKVIDKAHRKTQWSDVKNTDKRAMFAWTSQSLSKSSRKYLASLPKTRSIEIDGVQILLSHGSPESINEHLRLETPDERLAEITKAHTADVILCGHSHQAFIREVNGTRFINPGSVGRLDDGDPRPSYAVLEIDSGVVTAQFFRVPYNINAVVLAMRQTGLPEIFSEVLRQGINYNDAVHSISEPSALNRLESSGTITLLTDFGLKDPFVGVMKGVIADIAPQAQVIDISHQVRPQNITEAAWMLRAAIPYFSAGTVHVAVIDPGVGTHRRALAAQIGKHYFIAPDNGLLYPLIEDAREKGLPLAIYAMDQSKYWLPEPGTSFHGCDIFAPAAAHLANGLPLDRLGILIDDPVVLQLSRPVASDAGWQAEVVLVDSFGNLSTNFPGSLLPKDGEKIGVTIQNVTIHGLTHTFGDAQPGTLIATIDSSGMLSIAVVNGSAAKQMSADIETPLVVRTF